MEKQEFTHVLVTKDLGERLLAYLGTKPGSEVAVLMVDLSQAQGILVKNKEENVEAESQEIKS